MSREIFQFADSTDGNNTVKVSGRKRVVNHVEVVLREMMVGRIRIMLPQIGSRSNVTRCQFTIPEKMRRTESKHQHRTRSTIFYIMILRRCSQIVLHVNSSELGTDSEIEIQLPPKVDSPSICYSHVDRDNISLFHAGRVGTPPRLSAALPA